MPGFMSLLKKPSGSSDKGHQDRQAFGNCGACARAANSDTALTASTICLDIII